MRRPVGRESKLPPRVRAYPCILSCLVLLLAPLPAGADDASALSLSAAPAVQIPFAGSESSYTAGASMGIDLLYCFNETGGPLLLAGIDYAYAPYLGGNSLSLFAARVLGGWQFGLSPRFRLDAFGGAGYNVGFKNTAPGKTGQSLYAEARLAGDIVLSPALGLSITASCRLYAGLLTTASAGLGLSYYLTGTGQRRTLIESAKPINPELLRGSLSAAPGKGLSIVKLSINPVFPVFRKYYDTHPVGTITIRNNEGTEISDVTVGINIKEYMNDPKQTPVAVIGPHATVAVPLYALFNDHVLDTTEPTKTSAEITVDYRMGGSKYRAAQVESIRLLDRNAMTWDDNRRAAAFVTARDPAVLTFSKNVAGAIRDMKVKGVSGRLLAAFALHEALGLYGMTYVVDPGSSYAERSKSPLESDFLQFPRQTLQYRAGDCDDLSILNAALLESVGIPAAFITVPGHIFIAFALGIPEVEARQTYASVDDLIFADDDTWVPVEITNIQNGFLPAWKDGAREWREGRAASSAQMYPVREAWTVYEAVGLPPSGTEPATPSTDMLGTVFQHEVEKFIDGELSPQVQFLEASLKTTKDAQGVRNKLGVLYGRYGRYDEAEAQLALALQKGDYAPALVNLGNIAFLRGRWEASRAYYARALYLLPGNPRILLGISRAAYEMGDYPTSQTLFASVTKLDNALADKYSYLGEADATTTRAGDVAAMRESVPWDTGE
jgi:tetratricopeptide (TPR) repeat protein